CGHADAPRIRQPHLLCHRTQRHDRLSLHELESGQARGKDARRAAKLERKQGQEVNCRLYMPGVFAALAAVVLSGCGMLPQRPQSPDTTALPPSAESPLVRIAQASLPAPELTGFRLMPLGAYSLDAR